MFKAKLEDSFVAPKEAPPPRLPIPMPKTLVDAKRELAACEARQDWSRAAALKYAAIPHLEQHQKQRNRRANQPRLKAEDPISEPAPGSFEAWKRDMAAQIAQVMKSQPHAAAVTPLLQPAEISVPTMIYLGWGFLGWIPTCLLAHLVLSAIMQPIPPGMTYAPGPGYHTDCIDLIVGGILWLLSWALVVPIAEATRKN